MVGIDSRIRIRIDGGGNFYRPKAVYEVQLGDLLRGKG